MSADFGELRHAENPRSLDAKMHKTPSQLSIALQLTGRGQRVAQLGESRHGHLQAPIVLVLAGALLCSALLAWGYVVGYNWLGCSEVSLGS